MNDTMRKKRDYLFVYMLILALVLFVAGFYLGGVTVKDKYEDQIRILTTEENSNPYIKYLQTDFVSFYYGVIEPFNNLKYEHFTYLEQINKKDVKYDYKSKSKELLELSKATLNKINGTVINNSAPLLRQSKQTYIESLEYYQKGITGLLNKESMPIEINKFNESWLLAQKQFYESVVEWEKIYSKDNLETIDLDVQSTYDYLISDWKALSLHQKNYMISQLMERQPYIVPYHPEDISIHIDALANYEGIHSFDIEKIGKAIDLFLASNAITIGDYHKEKEKYYSDIATPLIPLYLTR